MNKSMKHILCMSLVTALSLLTSCRDQDFDFEKAYQENDLVAYANNFENIYGEIDPNQSWDLTTSASRSTTRTDGVTTYEVAGLDFWNSTTTTHTEETININDTLWSYVEARFKSSESVAQLFFAPKSGFTIYPATSWIGEGFSLYVKIGDNNPIKICDKEPNTNKKICNGYAKDYKNIKSSYTNQCLAVTSNGTSVTMSNITSASSNSALATDWVLSRRETTSPTQGANLKNVLYNPLINRYIKINETSLSLELTEYGSEASYYSTDDYGRILLTTSGSSQNTYYLYINSSNQLKVTSNAYDTWYESGKDRGNSQWAVKSNYKWSQSDSNTKSYYNLPGIHINAPEGTPIQIYTLDEESVKSHIEKYDVIIRKNILGQVKDEGTNSYVDKYGMLMVFTYTRNYDDCFVWVLPDNDPLTSVTIDSSGDSTNPIKSSTTTMTKRYMVEDLGAVESSDIDFNDIVFDMCTKETKTYTITDGLITGYTTSYPDQTGQTATIRAMGGTLDFDLLVNGKAIFTKSESLYSIGTMYNTTRNRIEYNRDWGTIQVSGWNPTTNNVSVKVYGSGNTAKTSASSQNYSNTWDIVFPGLGEVPYIIAFDPNKEWRDERHQICKDWLLGDEDAQWEWPEPHSEDDMTYKQWLENKNTVNNE